jgi:hypothetical protein
METGLKFECIETARRNFWVAFEDELGKLGKVVVED